MKRLVDGEYVSIYRFLFILTFENIYTDKQDSYKIINFVNVYIYSLTMTTIPY